MPGSLRSGTKLSAQRPEVQQAKDALGIREPDGRAALGRAQDGGRAPVAGVSAGVGGEQHDVGGDGRGVEVLLVLDGVAARAPR